MIDTKILLLLCRLQAEQIAFFPSLLRNQMAIIGHLNGSSPEASQAAGKQILDRILLRTNSNFASLIKVYLPELYEPADELSGLTVEELLQRLSSQEPPPETSE